MIWFGTEYNYFNNLILLDSSNQSILVANFILENSFIKCKVLLYTISIEMSKNYI